MENDVTKLTDGLDTLSGTLGEVRVALTEFNAAVSANELSPTPAPKPSLGEKTLKALGRVWTVVSADARLRVLLGGAITAGFAFLGLHIDGETALSMITAGALLAGIGPHQKASDA